jgi:hypothetical protein
MDRAGANKKSLWISLAVFAAALLVRLPWLGRAPLWGDEILFVRFMADRALTSWQVLLGYWDHCIDFGQLPLAGVAMNATMRAAGRFASDVASRVWLLRIPGAVAGAFAVLGGYWLGRRWLRREVNAAATAMAAVFFFPVYYSREIYCYPFVLLFAAFAFLFFFKSLFDESASPRTVAALLVWAAGLGLTHFGCSVALAAMGAVAAGRWILERRRHRPDAARRAAWTAVACGLAGLVVAPYWLRILTADSPHVASASPLSAAYIANDAIAKFFLGARGVPSALAWLFLAAGGWALARRKTDPAPARAAVWLILLTATVLILLVKHSQYASSRYFAMLTPLIYPVFAEGMWAVSRVLARPFRSPAAPRAVFFALVAVAAGIHAGLYLPELYRLPEKGVPYATTARWLSENAVPGSPYFFDGAGFDLRYVPFHYKTPGLVPTVEIAGNGPGFREDVEEIQRGVMRRFPVSYYIRNPLHPWAEADRFYRRAVEHRNPPMDRLRRYGIATDAETVNLGTNDREILYNTREDALAMAREAGEPIFVDHPGFRCAPVAPGVYGRVIDGREAEWLVTNLRGEAVRGAFLVSGALSGPIPESLAILELPSGRREESTLPCDRIWTWRTPVDELPAGTSTLRFAASDGAVEKLLVMDIRFVEP